MKHAFLRSIEERVVPADGAIGTQLQRMGLEPGEFGEVWNVEHPERVESVHRAYREAGAICLTTNSFRGNRLTLAKHNLAERTVELNRRAAEIAVRAGAGGAWVFGSIGPFGGFIEPLGETPADELCTAFREQARALLDGGADGIVVETMSALEEAETAVRAAREAGAAIVIAMMTFSKGAAGYRTMMGVSPENAALALRDAGADVVGTNCGVDLSLEDYTGIVREMSESVACPIIVRPNAGPPVLVGSVTQYREEPEAMAARVKALAEAGAGIIGGCCGTTPHHIRAFARVLAAL